MPSCETGGAILTLVGLGIESVVLAWILGVFGLGKGAVPPRRGWIRERLRRAGAFVVRHWRWRKPKPATAGLRAGLRRRRAQLGSGSSGPKIVRRLKTSKKSGNG